jgi:hypothetical protein
LTRPTRPHSAPAQPRHTQPYTQTLLRRYAKEDGDLENLERDLNEETGWKLVHGDVFRPPAHRMLLSAAVGTGMQLVLLGLSVILVTIMGTFYEVRVACLGGAVLWCVCVCACVRARACAVS